MAEEEVDLLSDQNGENDHDIGDRTPSNIAQYNELGVSKTIKMYENEDDTHHNKFHPDEFQKIFTKSKGICPSIWDKVITLIYIICIIVTIIMTVIYFMADEDTEEMLSLFIVCVSTWVGCIVAIIAIKNGLSVQGQTAELKQVNKGYWNQLLELKGTRQQLMIELKETRRNARELTAQEEQMRESVSEFGDLVKEFKKLKDIFPKAFDKTFDEIKKTDSLLKLIEGQNHRAKLYAAFFDAAGKNNEPGLAPAEFRKFMKKIPHDYSDKFEKLGLTFEKMDVDSDGNICKYEFEKAVAKVVDAVQADENLQVVEEP
eukprot:532897_1